MDVATCIYLSVCKKVENSLKEKTRGFDRMQQVLCGNGSVVTLITYGHSPDKQEHTKSSLLAGTCLQATVLS